MEETNYYAPNINEFRVGFEYEYKKDSSTWVKEEITRASHIVAVEQIMKYPKMDGPQIRIKYLDVSDMEELGFTLVALPIFIKNNYTLELHKEEDCRVVKIHRTVKYFPGNVEGIEQLFAGIIMNKTELKFIFDRLCISY